MRGRERVCFTIDYSKQKGRITVHRYCVYKHTAPDGRVYIGATMQEASRRWRNGNGYKRNPRFWEAIKQYGFDNFKHEILVSGLDRDTAYILESEYVKKHNSNDCMSGFNMTLGGLGTKGFIPDKKTRKKLSESRLGTKKSEEHKRKISCSNKGKHKHLIGRVHSEETKNKIRASLIGHNVSDETKEKIRVAKTGKYGIPVVMLSKDGCVINTYPSSFYAGNQLGIFHQSIYACCKHKRKTAGGFVFMFEDEYLKKQGGKADE